MMFEHQPLVQTNESGKFDIDGFLLQAKQQQRRWLIATSILSILSLGYAGYLLAQFPFQVFAPSPNPITACSPQSGPSYGLMVINIILALLPIICLGDQIRSYLKPAPSNGPGVISFKPYYIRPTNSDQVTSPEGYLQYTYDRNINWVQTTIIGMALLSGIGFSLTMFVSPQALCTNSWYTIRVPYMAGTLTYIGLFIAILATVVYQHKTQRFDKSVRNELDAYHPL